MNSRTIRWVFLTGILMAAIAPVHARINMLEPWSPGFDAEIPKDSWNHGVNARIGNDSNDVDIFELSYQLSAPLSPDWEVGGTLGFNSLSRPSPLKDDSGLNDLTFGAKHKFSRNIFPNPIQGEGEFGLSLPTGDPKNGLGAGGVGFFGGAGIKFPVGPVMGYSHLGLKIYTEGSDTRLGNVISYTLGAEYEVDREWTVTGDLRGFSHGKDKIDGRKFQDTVQELYLVPGVLWRPARASVHVVGSLLIGVSGDAFNFGLLGGIKF